MKPGPIQLAERLETAYVQSFMHGLHDAEGGGYLPEKMTARMRMINERMTTADVGDAATGAVRATLAEMDNEALTHCALDMVSIALDVLRIAT